MEEQKVYLKSMVDYISDQKEKVDISNYFMDTQNYSSFLKQELNISMFVPAILLLYLRKVLTALLYKSIVLEE